MYSSKICSFLDITIQFHFVNYSYVTLYSFSWMNYTKTLWTRATSALLNCHIFQTFGLEASFRFTIIDIDWRHFSRSTTRSKIFVWLLHYVIVQMLWSYDTQIAWSFARIDTHLWWWNNPVPPTQISKKIDTKWK